jgi:hypothetical protein
MRTPTVLTAAAVLLAAIAAPRTHADRAADRDQARYVDQAAAGQFNPSGEASCELVGCGPTAPQRFTTPEILTVRLQVERKTDPLGGGTYPVMHFVVTKQEAAGGKGQQFTVVHDVMKLDYWPSAEEVAAIAGR